MAWTIILEDENKNLVSSLSVEFTTHFRNDLSRFKLLCYLDAYGDTIFNRFQMDDLIEDLQNLKQIETNNLINEIQLLAERCKNEAHTYLVFYGD
ncbi:MAG: hypothetical protein H0U27_08900 [Nitrosopumilus sp.]|nr:hypothetical protein [Nitrosopumilus sp.]